MGVVVREIHAAVRGMTSSAVAGRQCWSPFDFVAVDVTPFESESLHAVLQKSSFAKILQFRDFALYL